MSEIIGSTYEVIAKIGSGGGGIVYLANHLRLNKQVVLKVDKRKITARPEVLRREVDVLKDLSHPFIPQVYDFFTDGNAVYTVMDYVDGESLDKALKRGERFSQPQVVKWAKQLLEALAYLHSPTHGNPPQGYVHSDIKPANIMLRENGDICLIDFNISLALGAENVVGASPGYASPEHYGLDFSSGSQTATQDDRTLPMNGDGDTATMTMLTTPSSLKKKVVPDARSDIYSVGATLYHLLSGRRPEKNAVEVTPLSKGEVSPQIAEIIAKAMEPNANLRYQTAAEMLEAFEHLRENDPRVKRHKRLAAAAAAVLSVIFFVGTACSFAGLRRMQQAEEMARLEAETAEEVQRRAKEAEQAEKEALAAVRDSEQRYQDGDIPGAVRSALNGLTVQTRYWAQAQKALTDALGVYDLSDGFRQHLLLTLPGEPLKALLSPEGTRVAVIADNMMLVCDTSDGTELIRLPVEPSALSDVVFSGEDTVIYAGPGGIRAYSLAEQKELWSGGTATGIALSGDGSTVAAVDRSTAAAVIYNAADGTWLRSVDFYGLRQSVVKNDIFVDPNDNLFALNGDGTLLAASFSNGALWIFDLRDSEQDIELYDQSEFTHFEGGFFGPYFAFAASDGAQSVLAIIDSQNLIQTGGLEAAMDIHMQVDESGIYVAAGRLVTQLDPLNFEETERAYASYAADQIRTFSVGEKYTILATLEGGFALFDGTGGLLNVWETGQQCDIVDTAGDYTLTANWNTPTLQILKRENHQDARLFSYDSTNPHSEARVSADSSTAMLFRHDGFRLYGKDGTVLTEQVIPDAEQVYDQQYRRSEGYLEVIYNNGLIRCYSVMDGLLLSEEQGEVPDETMYEEFFTDRLKITSSLHGTPAAYDRDSGALVRELDEDAYLTYVTQVGEYIVTQYVSTKGERYGLLLNADCEMLARLPGLCDILEDGTLVFDDDRGNLRQSHIYSAQELILIGKNTSGEVP